MNISAIAIGCRIEGKDYYHLVYKQDDNSVVFQEILQLLKEAFNISGETEILTFQKNNYKNVVELFERFHRIASFCEDLRSDLSRFVIYLSNDNNGFNLEKIDPKITEALKSLTEIEH